MAPVDVRPEHETKIWIRLYGDGSTSERKEKLAPGQSVRISKWKGEFEKGYMPNWTEESFRVQKVLKHPHTVYELKDEHQEPLTGAFYGSEVQSIRTNKFLLDRVLRRRTNHDGLKQAYVKWKGWPDKYNTWIPARDLPKYRKVI